MARSVSEAMAIAFGGARPDSTKKKLPGTSIEDSAKAAARKHGIDEKVFLRLIRQESAGDTAAVSKKGAIGLGQLMPDTARELGVDPKNPLENLDGSARYLKQQLDRFGSYDLALAAYNAGPGAVDEAGGVPDFPETQAYVKRIMGDSVATKPKRTVAEAMAAEFGGVATSEPAATAAPSGPVEAGFLESLAQVPAELLHTLRAGINPEQFAAEISRGVSDVATSETGNTEAAARLGARGQIAGATTSLLPGGPALKAGPALIGTLAARAGLGALGGAAGGAAEAATRGGDVGRGALMGGTVGAVFNPVVGGIEAGIGQIVKARLAKRLTEMELETGGRVASPKNVKEISDLVRTSQELGDAATLPPPATIATEPLGASIGGDRAIPFTGRALQKTMTPILNQHDLALPEDAQRAITGFVGHAPGAVDNPHSTGFGIMDERLLEDAYSATPSPEGAKVREQLDAARQALVSDLRGTYGDEITLYRYQRPVAADAKPRNVLSWTANKNFAEDIAGLKKYGALTNEQIDTAVSELEKSGTTKLRGKTYRFAAEDEFPGIVVGDHDYTIDINQGETPAAALRRELLDQQGELADYAKLDKNLSVERIQTKTVPISDIVWATDRAGQHEFILPTAESGRPRMVSTSGGAAPEPGLLREPAKPTKGIERTREFTPGKQPPAAVESGFTPPSPIPSAMDDIERHVAAGRPVPESIANSARAEVATALGADAGPVERVLQALRKAPRIINRQKALIRAERGRRAAAGLARRPEGGGGAAGYRMQKSAMAGEMTALDFEALHEVIPQADMDALHNMVYTTKKLDLFERLTAERGLTSMFSGKLPTTDELKKLRAVFGDAFVKEVLDKRGDLAKLGDLALQTLGGWRSFITSYDLSAPLQQGLYAAAGNPKEAAKALGAMFKAAVSPKAFDELAQQIVNRPTYLLMRRSGLGLTDMGHILSDREEAFASHWAEKIPGVGASNRAYVAFLNKMRADVFDKMVREMRATGLDPNSDLLATKEIADFVNDATGRGALQIPLGKDAKIDLSRHADLLNAGFFSPRLMMSRVRLLNPGLYVHTNPVVRKQALRSLFGMAAAGTTILGLAKAAGAEVEANPKATDFGRIKVGNTRYDIFGGFTQYARLAANLMPGAGGPDSGTRLDYASRFLQGKASPAAGFALDLLRGGDFKGMPLDQPLQYGGQDTPVPAWVADRFVPLMMQDVYDVMQEQGPMGAWMSLPAMFGVRMATYDG